MENSNGRNPNELDTKPINETVMNIYVVSNFDPDKGYNFDQFKETYTKNAHPQLIDFISN